MFTSSLVLYDRINRTFMELKLTLCIVKDGAAGSINRTFMELKLPQHLLGVLGKLGINRTFMELKQRINGGTNGMADRINRTFMELKPFSCSCCR